MEIWESIEGFTGYQISNYGRARSNKKGSWKILKQCLSGPAGRTKYKFVSLHKKGKGYPIKIHRLVALAFLGPRPVGFQISHIDENRFNNRATNLCYESVKDNNNRPISQMRKSMSRAIGASGYRGVCKVQNRWEVRIRDQSKNVYLGSFSNPKDGAKAYDKKELELNGEHAVTNKLLGLL